MSQNIPSDDLLQILNEKDSSKDRKPLILACIKATELAREKRFKEAIKELERVFRDESDTKNRRKKALKYICLLLEQYDDFKGKSLYNFFLMVKKEINTEIANLKTGSIKDFYEQHTYQELAVCVKITEDASLHRTIHKAKGAEFDNVLLILCDEKGLEFLLNPDLEKKEEHRINYVAVSRAKEQLFISVPALTALSVNDSAKLENLFNVISK